MANLISLINRTLTEPLETTLDRIINSNGKRRAEPAHAAQAAQPRKQPRLLQDSSFVPDLDSIPWSQRGKDAIASFDDRALRAVLYALYLTKKDVREMVDEKYEDIKEAGPRSGDVALAPRRTHGALRSRPRHMKALNTGRDSLSDLESPPPKRIKRSHHSCDDPFTRDLVRSSTADDSSDGLEGSIETVSWAGGTPEIDDDEPGGHIAITEVRTSFLLLFHVLLMSSSFDVNR